MAIPVGRITQRHDLYIQSAPLQGQDLLGDEGFGEPGIALQHKCDFAGHGSVTIRQEAGVGRATIEVRRAVLYH